MANTFLKRKWTLRRIWELYRDRVPTSVHLFMALAAFLAATTPSPVPSATPFYDVVTAGPIARLLSSDFTSWFWFLVGPLAMASALSFGALCLVEWGQSIERAVCWSAMATVATIVWPLTREAPLDGLVAALLMALVLVAVRLRREPTKVGGVVFALVFIAVVALRTTTALLIPLFVVFLLASSSLPDRLCRWWYLLAVCGALLLFTLLTALAVTTSDVARLAAGIAPWQLVDRLWALVAAPGRSVFLYSPPLVFVFVGLRVLSRHDGAAARLVGGICLVGVVAAVVCSAAAVAPPWRSEPLLPYVPVAMMMVAFAAEERRRVLVAAVVVFGVAVQVTALMAGSVVLSSYEVATGDALIYNPSQCLLRTGLSIMFTGGGPSLTVIVHRVTSPDVGLFYLVAAVIAVLGTAALVVKDHRPGLAPRPCPASVRRTA